MKFRVVGSNRETGARMTLEFEALSKAQAERKAQQAGMAVNRVEVFSQVEGEEVVERRRARGGGWMAMFVVLLVVAGVVYFWMRGRGIVH